MTRMEKDSGEDPPKVFAVQGIAAVAACMVLIGGMMVVALWPTGKFSPEGMAGSTIAGVANVSDIPRELSSNQTGAGKGDQSSGSAAKEPPRPDTILGQPAKGLMVYVDDQLLAARNLTGLHTIRVEEEGKKPVVMVQADLSQGSLNVSSLTFAVSKEKRGAAQVHGLSLPPGAVKSLFVPQVAGAQEVCIQDADNALISNISRDCSGPLEVRVFCDGVFNFGFRCRAEGGFLIVDGLKHSAAAEIVSEVVGTGISSAKRKIIARNITIQKYRINLSQEPQSFELDLRDAVEFTVGWKKYVVIHAATGLGNATFKVLPARLMVVVTSGGPVVVDVNDDAVEDLEMVLRNISFDNATVSFSLPLGKQPAAVELPAGGMESLDSEAMMQARNALPPAPGLGPSLVPMEPAASGGGFQERLPSLQKPLPRVASVPVPEEKAGVVPQPPVQAVQAQLLEDSVMALAGAYPWMLPALGVAAAAVACMVGYALYLLMKEWKAVQEISGYVTQSLGMGFPLPKIMDALRQQGWTAGHIRKSLVTVASHYRDGARIKGKSLEEVRADLLSGSWPQDIVDAVVPISKKLFKQQQSTRL